MRKDAGGSDSRSQYRESRARKEKGGTEHAAILQEMAGCKQIIPAKHPNSSIRDFWDAMAQHMSITTIQSQAEGTGNQSQAQGTGNQSQAQGTGKQSQAQGTGNQ